jgi:hypothetical protein
MMAHRCVSSAAGQIETRGFVSGQIRSVGRAWCHARILPSLGPRSECTTTSVCAVDHHDIQVGRSPVGASVDQVQGIQEGSGLQAGERMGTTEKHQTRGRLGCSEVNQPSTSGGSRQTRRAGVEVLPSSSEMCGRGSIGTKTSCSREAG